MAGGTPVSDRNRRRVSFALAAFCVLLLTGLVQYRHVIFNGSASTNSSSNGNNNKKKSSSWSYTGEDDPTLPKPWVDSATTWWDLHRTLVKEVQLSDQTEPLNEKELPVEPQLVFYGDSITESWRGTSFGTIPPPTRKWKTGEEEQVKEVFSRYFGSLSSRNSVKPPLVLGISGDQTQHLLWRMQNDEFPSSTTERIFIVLIGTNNLGGGTLPQDTARGIKAVCQYILQQQNNASVLLSELLPRYDKQRVARLCPPRCNKDGKPFKSFMPAIEKVNAALPGIVQELRQEFAAPARIAISSCGSSIFTRGGVDEIMPDHLHPNAQGHELWAQCLSKHIASIMSQDSSTLELVLTNDDDE